MDYSLQEHDIEILKRTRDLVATGWTRNTDARNAHGKPVDFESPVAKRFCLFGALQRALYEIDGKDAIDGPIDHRCSIALHHAVRSVDRGLTGFVAFNDSHTTSKKDVLTLVDKVIQGNAA